MNLLWKRSCVRIVADSPDGRWQMADGRWTGEALDWAGRGEFEI